MLFDPQPNAVRKDVADESVAAAPRDNLALTIDNGRLYVEGCDCMTAVEGENTAREMVALLTRWINAEVAP